MDLNAIYVLIVGMVMTEAKGHEPKMYETLTVIAGLFFTFIILKMKGPNKSLNCKKTCKNLEYF